ncbi:MAG: hypothetical protein WCF84_16260 [Anaerolineae bacterium]
MNRLVRGLVEAMIAVAVLTGLVACSTPAATSAQPPAVTLAQPTSGSPSPTIATPTQIASTTAAPTQAVLSTTIAQAPACTSPASLTPAETEGPYFKAGSPERASLFTSGMTGTKLVLTGYVVTADCKPVANALLDFWQADASGNYDNSGYTLRGHQYTDASGRYQLTTVVPGLYPGRTEHIHVKVQAPGGPILTTQLYFPGVALNSSDGIFDPKMVMNVQT